MLSVSDFVNFTIATPSKQLPSYNPNVLGLLTRDAPLANFGTGATAHATLTAQAISAVTLDTAGTGYTTPPPIFVIGGGGTGAVLSAAISGGAITAITIVSGGSGYTSLPTLVVGQNLQIYSDPVQVGIDFGTTSETYNLALEVFGQSPSILSGGGFLAIYAMASTDTLSQAIAGLSGQLFCGGFIYGAYSPNSAEVQAASTLVAALQPKRMLFAPTNLLADLYAGGMSYIISAAGQTWTRLLIHTASALQARLFAAAYASRLMSVLFSGANTTLTMNLKQLSGIPADAGINETVALQCQTIGVDFVAQVANLAEVVSTGGNDYSDNIYNLTWLLSALQVAVFNGLSGTPTKIPQTESGINTIKNLIVSILQQAVANGFLAPGAWTGTYFFGDPASMLSNIAAFGFYIYSTPVSQQSAADRAARKAPPIQIAIKYAGAVQSVQGIIYINP